MSNANVWAVDAEAEVAGRQVEASAPIGHHSGHAGAADDRNVAAAAARLLRSDVHSGGVGPAAVDFVALRHHLDALILKLATAQAGSFDAIKQSRQHAEAARGLLIDSGAAPCEHARVAGVREADEGWECRGCGARWPKEGVARTQVRLRPERNVLRRGSITIAAPLEIDRATESANSL